ncbi:hypothetical protein B0H14DRAFT_2586115 [Mycena olivaceomarginata]|nr:hypothetical protein B0H14DRAFT_2586115 [Mycena olivaceomarginata]
MGPKPFSIKLFNVSTSCDAASLPDTLPHAPPDPRPKPALLGRRAQEEHAPAGVAAAAGVWSEAAYARRIFGGAGRRGFRARTACECGSARINAKPSSTGPLRQDRGQRLPNLMRHPRPARPAADGPDTAAAFATGCQFPMYRASAVATADQEWFSARAITERRACLAPARNCGMSFKFISNSLGRMLRFLNQEYKLRAEALPRIMQNAKALQKWSAEFSEARKAVDLVNVAFFKEVITSREQIPYRKLLQTQAVRDVMEAFGRSLSTLDIRFSFQPSARYVRRLSGREYRAEPVAGQM